MIVKFLDNWTLACESLVCLITIAPGFCASRPIGEKTGGRGSIPSPRSLIVVVITQTAPSGASGRSSTFARGNGLGSGHMQNSVRRPTAPRGLGARRGERLRGKPILEVFSMPGSLLRSPRCPGASWLMPRKSDCGGMRHHDRTKVLRIWLPKQA